MKSRTKLRFYTFVVLMLVSANFYGQPQDDLSLKSLIDYAIKNSEKLQIRQLMIESTELDKTKAKQVYIPKITAEGTYTRLNDDIRLPVEMEQLLTATQMLLIKEATATQMAGLPIPNDYKVNFATPYSGTDPASLQLQKAINENLKEITPIQYKNIFKANISGQMVLFSGLKVSYSLKSANHLINSYKYLSEKEKSTLIADVALTYYMLTVINESAKTLQTTENYLSEQLIFVEKSKQIGLAVELDYQKILIAKQQLEIKKIELSSNKKLIISKLSALTAIPESALFNLEPKIAVLQNISSANTTENYSEIRALDEGIKALDYKRKSEYSEYIPKIFAFGKKELYTKDLSAFDPEWYVGIGVRWTLFDGFVSHNYAQHAKIERDIIIERKNEAEKLININTKRLTYELEKQERLLELANLQLKTSELSFQLTKKQYEAGLTSITEFLASLNQFEAAKLELVKTTYAYNDAIIQLMNATGRLSEETF